MMSRPYTYLRSLTHRLICWWWCHEITPTLEALHFIWSADDDVMTLHLPWKPYTSFDLHMMMTRSYTCFGSLKLDLICISWRQDLALIMGASHFICSVDDHVKTLHLPWYTFIHLIWGWWWPYLTLTLWPLHFIWSVDDDVQSLHLPRDPYTSSDLWMMMSKPYTYLGSHTRHVICRWCRPQLTLNLGAIHFMLSLDDDVKTLHLRLEPQCSSDM